MAALDVAELGRRLSIERRRVPRGTALYRKGDPCPALFVVWAGCFKLCLRTAQGQAQVTGFAMSGDWLGLEGIASHRQEGEAVALEDAQVWVVPYPELEALCHEPGDWQQRFNRTLSHELARRQAAMLLLVNRSAEVRVATFLIDLAERAAARGYSASAIVLRMTRSDIGSCLGLSLETVSRTFSRLQAEGLLCVQSRHIRITDAVGLQRVCDRG